MTLPLLLPLLLHVDRIKANDLDITRNMLSTGGVFDTNANGAVGVNSNNKLNLQYSWYNLKINMLDANYFQPKQEKYIFI